MVAIETLLIILVGLNYLLDAGMKKTSIYIINWDIYNLNKKELKMIFQ